VTVAAHFPTWLVDGISASLLGPLAAIADSAGGFAVFSTLPPGRLAVTAQLRLDVINPQLQSRSEWSCRAWTRHVTDDVGLAHGEINSAAGTRTALISLWAAITRPATFDNSEPSRSADAELPSGHDVGLELRPGLIADEARRLLDLPLCGNLRITCPEATGGRARLLLPPDPRLANSLGSMHGGAIALLADLSTAVALSSMPGPRAVEPMRIWEQVDYMRPVSLTGHTEFWATVTTRSARSATVEGEVIRSDGQVAARIRQASLI
jgi:uncharacterized protein (TIGR00369 family)